MKKTIGRKAENGRPPARYRSRVGGIISPASARCLETVRYVATPLGWQLLRWTRCSCKARHPSHPPCQPSAVRNTRQVRIHRNAVSQPVLGSQGRPRYCTKQGGSSATVPVRDRPERTRVVKSEEATRNVAVHCVFTTITIQARPECDLFQHRPQVSKPASQHPISPETHEVS